MTLDLTALDARTIADAREIYNELIECGYAPKTARHLARKAAEDQLFARQDIRDSAGLADWLIVEV